MIIFTVLAFLILASALFIHKVNGELPPAILLGAFLLSGLVFGLGFVAKGFFGERDVSHLTTKDEALGYVLAHQLKTDGTPAGTVAVKNPVARGEAWKKRIESRIAGIEKAFEGTGYTLDTSGRSTPKLQGGSMEESGSETSGIDAATSGDAVATISFIGPPRSYGQNKHPYYVVVRSEHDASKWHSALKKGYLSGVAMEKMRRAWGSYEGDDLHQVFNNRYDLHVTEDLQPLSTILER